MKKIFFSLLIFSSILIFSCGSSKNNSDNSTTNDNLTTTNSFSDFYASFKNAIQNNDETSFFELCLINDDNSLQIDEIINYWGMIFNYYVKDVISSQNPNNIEESKGQNGEIIKYLTIPYDDGATISFVFTEKNGSWVVSSILYEE